MARLLLLLHLDFTKFPPFHEKLFLTVATLSLLVGAPLSHAFAQRGHYKGGHGSSHKGGHYKNKATNNHYRKRK